MKNNNIFGIQNMKNEYFECACHSPEHRLVFTCDIGDEFSEIWTEVYLHTYENIFKKIWTAIKYVFGYKCQWGHFDCFVLQEKDARRLRDMLDKFIQKISDEKNK